MLFLLQLGVGAVSFALGLIPFIGAVATIVLYPFVLTYIVGMYFQARSEGQLVDAVLGWPRQAPAGPPAYSAPAAPYGASGLAAAGARTSGFEPGDMRRGQGGLDGAEYVTARRN